MNKHLPECPVWRCCKPDERATLHTCICPYDERIVGLITRQRAEQIGRNIGQYGCVINEQRHLPECPSDGDCICKALRSCEERVRREEWLASGIYAMGRDDAVAECISLGHRHIDRINEEAEAAISEQVANQLFMNADGIEFLVGELSALQTLREAKQ